MQLSIEFSPNPISKCEKEHNSCPAPNFKHHSETSFNPISIHHEYINQAWSPHLFWILHSVCYTSTKNSAFVLFQNFQLEPSFCFFEPTTRCVLILKIRRRRQWAIVMSEQASVGCLWHISICLYYGICEKSYVKS